MKKNNSRLYWLCQVLGWGGMVGIETTNYTFFIVKKFDWYYVTSFGYAALLGIAITHIFRYFIGKSPVFSWSRTSIWMVAAGSSVAMSTLLYILTMAPSLISNPNYMKEIFSPISLSAGIINWMRYIGVWVIIYFMYRLLEQNNIIKNEKLELETAAKSAELELLKTQLNPHFLFNALNSIKALVVIDPEKSKDAIVKLSELLRFTLNYGQQSIIPIHDEINEVKKYLSLEQIRFGDRLVLEYDIPENTLSKTLPPALILTLAENAIKHGIAKQAGEGKVAITTLLRGQDLVIQVTNSGKLVEINSGGIGLRSIRKRLEGTFTGKATLTLTEKDGFVTAEVIIPNA